MAKKRLRRSVSFNERKNSKQKLFWIILTLIIIVGVLFVAWRYFNANSPVVVNLRFNLDFHSDFLKTG